MANTEKWLHPRYRHCFCYRRGKVVYTSVFSIRESTFLLWKKSNYYEALRLLEERYLHALNNSGEAQREILLADAVSEYLTRVAGKKTKSTIALYHYSFTSLLALPKETKLSETDKLRKHILQSIEELSQKLTPSTINAYLAKTTAFFAWCIRNEMAKKNPVRREDFMPCPPTPNKSFTETELLQILDYMQQNYERGIYLFFYVLMLTGMRQGELLQARIDDVHSEDLVIHGKGGFERTFPFFFVPELRSVIFELVETAKSNNREKLCRYDRASYWYAFRDTSLFLFNEYTRPIHTIRKTVGNIWRDNGMDVETRSLLLGHAVAIEVAIYNKHPDVSSYAKRLSEFTHSLHTANDENA